MDNTKPYQQSPAAAKKPSGNHRLAGPGRKQSWNLRPRLLTGKAPIADPQFDTLMKKLTALATKEPQQIRDLRPDCPPELARLVHRMLSKDPADRPGRPSEVASALKIFARGADLRRLLEPNDALLTNPGIALTTTASVNDATNLSPTAVPCASFQGRPDRAGLQPALVGLG